MDPKKRKLFVSFEGLLKAIAQKRVCEPDLRTGLYCLNCSYSVPTSFALGETRHFNHLIDDHCIDDIRHLLMINLGMAKYSGRSVWREHQNEQMNLSHIRYLLRNNGYEINVNNVNLPLNEFTGDNIRAWLNDIGLSDQLEVID